MSEVASPAKRKVAAKRFNENVKLAANSINTAALTIFGTALILPAVSGAPIGSWGWLAAAVSLHLLAQAVLRLIRSED